MASAKMTIDTSGLDELNENVRRIFSYDTMDEISNFALNFFIDCFNNQGFTDVSFQPWQKSLKDAGATLVLSGQLRNSIRVGNITSSSFTIISDLPYSEIHNNGGSIIITDQMRNYFYAMYKQTNEDKWLSMYLYAKKNTVLNIPKRQYMGESETLLQDILDFVNQNNLT